MIVVLSEYSDGYCMETVTTWLYTGNITTTNRGYTCQRWDQQTHWSLANHLFADGSVAAAGDHCRDLKAPYSLFTLWCFVTDPDVEGDYCDAKHCVDGVSFLSICFKQLNNLV